MKRFVLATTAAMVTVWVQTACQAVPHVTVDQALENSVMSGVPVPEHVRRLAVWYPRTSEGPVVYGYNRLEQAVFQLKKQRSWIKIVERRHMESLTDEQRLQVSGRVADESAMGVGKWLGADSIVLFRIDVPTWRTQLLGGLHQKMPPVVVSSKIISVESGEVLYHDIVTTHPVPPSGKRRYYTSDFELQPALRSALDDALSVAIAHLDQSFR